MADNKKPETLKADTGKDDVNKRELTPEDKTPQKDETVQGAANESVTQARGTLYGDNTSSSGEQNVRGLHGRDGGVTGAPEGGGPHNPVADEQTIDPSKREDNENSAA